MAVSRQAPAQGAPHPAIPGVAPDPRLVVAHERRDASANEALVGRRAPGGEGLYARRRGLRVAGHKPDKTPAILVGQPVAVAQDAQPAGPVRRRGPAVPGATGVAGEGGELPGAPGEVPRGRRRGGGSWSKNATGGPPRKTVFIGEIHRRDVVVASRLARSGVCPGTYERTSRPHSSVPSNRGRRRSPPSPGSARERVRPASRTRCRAAPCRPPSTRR